MKLIQLESLRLFHAIKAGTNTVESFSREGIGAGRSKYRLILIPDWGVIQISEYGKDYVVCVSLANVVHFVPRSDLVNEFLDHGTSKPNFSKEDLGETEKKLNELDGSKAKPPLPKSK